MVELEAQVVISEDLQAQVGESTVSYEAQAEIGEGGGGTYQTKTKSYTPTESTQSEDVTPDEGYTGLEKVTVNVTAISSTYVGSGVSRKTSSDLQVSNAKVTAPAGYYESAASASVASGTAGTPTATKGSVSNHAITVTPSVTNTTGYITGGTKTGTGVSVAASELVSGNLSLTANTTNADCTNYQTVTVNVTSGSGKNVQVAEGCTRIASSTYTDCGMEITVAKAGTYNILWAGYRSSTSGTSGAQVYKNGSTLGSAQTSFDGTWTNVQKGHLASQTLAANDKITIRARSRGSNYYMYIWNLTIQEV